MNQDYQKQFEKLYSLEKQIIQKLNLRDGSSGNELTKADILVKKLIEQIQKETQIISDIVKNQELDPKQYNLQQKEVEKRKNAVNDFYLRIDKFVTQLSKNYKQKSLFNNQNNDLQEALIKNNDPNTLMEFQKQQYKQQDEKVDDIQNMLMGIQDANKQINENLKTDIKLMDQIEGEIDQTHDKMSNLKDKLELLLKKSSECCIILVIIVNVFILIIQISFF